MGEDWMREGTAMLAGDLNASPWSKAFEPIHNTSLRDARLGFGFCPTWPAFAPKPMRIPIDHLLVGPSWIVTDFRIGPDVNSDHLPISAKLIRGQTP